MQVTPESLQKDLQWITGILCTADFIAIDCEMTGLGMANDRLDFLDSLQERYTKVRTSAEQFQLVQYGICAFKWESESKAYVATPLNAFIFPKASSGALGIQKTFVCQASSLEFLKSHSFDFNAWIEQGLSLYNASQSVHLLRHQKTGLSYVSMQEEAIARTRINKTVARDEIPIDEKNSEFVETTMNTIRDWLQNSTEATLMLTAMNAYQRRLVYQETPKRWVSLSEHMDGTIVFNKRLNSHTTLQIQSFSRCREW